MQFATLGSPKVVRWAEFLVGAAVEKIVCPVREIGDRESIRYAPRKLWAGPRFVEMQTACRRDSSVDWPTITCVHTTSVSTPGTVYDGAVESADLGEWDRELDRVVARIAPLFYRSESRRHGEQYLRGLLSPLAARTGGRSPSMSGSRS